MVSPSHPLSSQASAGRLRLLNAPLLPQQVPHPFAHSRPSRKSSKNACFQTHYLLSSLLKFFVLSNRHNCPHITPMSTISLARLIMSAPQEEQKQKINLAGGNGGWGEGKNKMLASISSPHTPLPQLHPTWSEESRALGRMLYKPSPQIYIPRSSVLTKLCWATLPLKC